MRTKKEKKTTPTPIQSPKDQSRIQNVAMLARLSISIWRAARADDTLTEEVARSHNSDKDMGTYKRYLIDPRALDPIEKAAGDAYLAHRNLTLPWQDEGFRILSSAGYLTYTEKLRGLETAYWKEVNDKFLPEYSNHKARAKSKLNGLYNEAEYPSPTQLVKKFGFRLSISPVPNFEDWRVNLADAEVNMLKAEGQNQLQEQLKTSVSDIWVRLQAVISKMVERLNAYTVGKDGKVQNSFRDTLVSNISDVIELVPILNVLNDPNIDQFAARIRNELLIYNPDTLRSNERLRKDVAKRAEEIMSKMSSFLS